MSCKAQMPGGQQPPRVEYTHNEHWGVPILNKESCANRTYSAPSPSPFPFSHHVQASCSAACTWVRKGEGGRGWGSVLLPTHNGQPLPLLRENEKLCIILSSYVVKLINTTVRHPIVPKQDVRSDVLQSPTMPGGSSPPE